jgi:CHAT domain-containing protein/ABC-type Fe2+-enterobactin transport system substrate-binding protein
MDELKPQTYAELIAALVACPAGEENDLLNRCPELVNMELVAAMFAEADSLLAAGQEETAARVRSMAEQIANFLQSPAAGGSAELLMALLQAEMSHEGDEATEAVHQVMRGNLAALTPALGEAIIGWARSVLAEHPEDREDLSSLLGNICMRLQEFPEGYGVLVNQIALAGYAIVLELRADQPDKRAHTLNDSGNAYLTLSRLGEDPAANLKEALKAYNESIATRREYKLWRDLANTLNNAGTAYLTLSELGEDSAANLKEALKVYNESIAIYREYKLWRDLASTLNNAGTAYCKLAELGEAPAIKLKSALKAYNESITIRRKYKLWRDLSGTLNNAGTAYCKFAELGEDPAANLTAALKAYSESIAIRREYQLWQDLAGTLNNVGTVYRNFAELGEDPTANLKASLEAYNESIAIYRKYELWRDLAMTLMGAGIAYRNFAELGEDPTANLKASLAAYNESIAIYRKYELWRDLAMTLMGAGNAYCNFAELGEDPTANLKASLAAYNESIAIYRKYELWRDLAMTLNNVGNVYRNFAKLGEDPAANLTAALKAYNESIAIYKEYKLWRDLAMTLNNAGNAYCDFIELGEDPAANLIAALEAYNKSITIYRKYELWRNLAMALNNVGNTYLYSTLSELGKDPTANLKSALKAYNESITIRREYKLWRDLAMTLNNAGNAYVELAKQGEEIELNHDQAIAHYREALSSFPPTILPVECLKVARSLGNLGFRLGQWDIALEGYSSAIIALQQTRLWAKDEKMRQQILENAIDIYSNAVQACINSGQIERAITLAESSRSRQLVELMATNDLYKDGQIDPQVQAWLDATRPELEKLWQEYNDLQSEIVNRQATPDQPDTKLASIKTAIDLKRTADEVNTLRAQQNTVWQKIRKLDPVLAGVLEVRPPAFSELQELVTSPTTALISFYTVSDCTYAFVLRQDASGTVQVKVHHCPNQGLQELHTWLLEKWLLPYQKALAIRQLSTWIATMPALLAEMSDRLQLDTLIAEHLQDIQELVIIPHVLLHILPFAAMPLGSDGNLTYSPEATLGERFKIRYAPSTQVLQYCQERGAIDQVIRSTVEDATSDLQFSRLECEAIAQLLSIPPELRLQTTQATVANYRKLSVDGRSNLIHSSHHASSDLANPLNSGLILADGKITVGQLLTPLWRMEDLDEIFFSCCETNLGIPSLTDDLLTIGTGFLCAGARAVISTLWAVEELATALFCIHYYQQRQAGLDRPTAIHEAQKYLRSLTLQQILTYLQAQFSIAQASQDQQSIKAVQRNLKAMAVQSSDPNSTPYSSPYYWAGFICQGMA